MWWWPVACKSSITTMYLPYMFFQHMAEYLGNKLLDLLGYSLLGVLTPMFPLSYKLFAGHLTWKMAIHNLIIFITHLKISHVENKVPFKFLLFQQKKPHETWPWTSKPQSSIIFLNVLNTLASLSSSLARSRKKINPTLSSWWFQPIWKILVKMVIFPN